MDVHHFGVEWVVDARGCASERLRNGPRLQALFDRIVREAGLHPIGRAAWHRFPVTSGYTGIWMLTESHLACHSFPEFGSLCVNLFCCRPRPAWPWKERLAEMLGASQIRVRRFVRRYGSEAAGETA